MNAIIRRAKKEDCIRIMELIKELATYEKSPEEVTVEYDHFVESGFGTSPIWWAFVAELDGKVEGFALYYIRYSTWKGQTMYLEDLIITNEQRGKGLGKMLINKLIEECKDKNLQGLSWQVLDWNQPAIDFYNKFPGIGISSEWLNFNLNL
jgi:GNAT superfamily N-acetyltransferase